MLPSISFVEQLNNNTTDPIKIKPSNNYLTYGNKFYKYSFMDSTIFLRHKINADQTNN